MSVSLLLISVTDGASDRAEKLERMIASVAAFASTPEGQATRLLLLVQRATDNYIQSKWSNFVERTSSIDLLSASAARNLMIAQARELGLLREDVVVLFPDDDCWYPDGLLAELLCLFTKRPILDLWFCRYGSRPEIYASLERPARPAEATRRTSCNTIVIRGHLLANGLRFDETLGIGKGVTHLGGEDTLFALKAFGRGRETLFLDRACIGHRDAEKSYVSRYYSGGLMAIAQSAAQPGITREFMRKILIGAVFVLQGRLKAVHYVGVSFKALFILIQQKLNPRIE